MILGSSTSGDFKFNRIIIESDDLTHVWQTERSLKRVQVQQQGQTLSGTSMAVIKEQWVLDNSI